jgi:mRNA guanylyltransferase
MSDLVIPGIKLTGSELNMYQSRISQLLKLNKNIFPGAQPISFSELHLGELCKRNYFVSEKADGIRLLLFSTIIKTTVWKPIMILIDRKNDYYKIENYGFPSKDSAKFLLDTLVDGELVHDLVKKKKYLLLFDALMVDGKLLVDRAYTSRLGYLREIVLKPYLAYCKSNNSKNWNLGFEIRQKKVEPCYKLNQVFINVKDYNHSNDGLMFTDSEAKYAFGTCETMVKWKPPEENTVDFLLQVRKSNAQDKYYIMINHGNKGYQIESEFVFGQDLDKIKGETLNGRIIECKYDKNWPFKWRFSRFRDDKSDANHISTFQKVLKSIEDNVTMEKLLEIRQDIESCWREREAKTAPVKRHLESVSQSQPPDQRGSQDLRAKDSSQDQKEIRDKDDIKNVTISERDLLSVDFD